MNLTLLSMLKKRCIISVFILLLLSGCGSRTLPAQNQSNTLLGPSGKTTFTPSSSSNPSTSGLVPLGTSVSFDLGKWLHVQSAEGFTCNFTTNGRPFTPGTLVLPTVQPTYDQGTLQSLKNYLMTADQVTQGGKLDAIPYPPFSVNSDAFQLVPVSSGKGGVAGCGETMQVTNIGNSLLQISQVSVQFMADTQANKQHYNLINLCSLYSTSCFPAGGGEGGNIAAFDVGSTGKFNTIMPATFWGNATMGSSQAQALSLKPGEVAKVFLSYYSHSSELSFSLRPTFTLDWPGTGQQTIYSAPQLQATFVLASHSQFSCYSLQGQQFTEVSLEDYNNYCM